VWSRNAASDTGKTVLGWGFASSPLAVDGAASIAPADGTLLWDYAWPSETRIVQPAVTLDGDVLMIAMNAGGGTGMRRIAGRARPRRMDRDWKGGRYGNGQLVLLPEQDVVLVLTEEGEVGAGRGDVLLVRNGQEMAAFRLPPRTPPITGSYRTISTESVLPIVLLQLPVLPEDSRKAICGH
jgi:hypothetical protein